MDYRDLMKPCPFCGKKVEVSSMDFDGTGVLRIDVECSCGASINIESDDVMSDWQGHRYQLGKNAFEKWNTRAEQTERKESE